MSTKRKSEKRQRSSRNPWLFPMVTVGIILVAVLFTVSYLYQRSSTVTPKKPSSEYFVFSDIGAEAEQVQGTNDSVIRVGTLHFNVTAVGGNATALTIFANGLADPTEHSDLFIGNQSTLVVDLKFPSLYQSVKQGSYYPMRIELYCREAEGWVTLNIPESSVFYY